jgi:hypothetical protein
MQSVSLSLLIVVFISTLLLVVQSQQSALETFISFETGIDSTSSPCTNRQSPCKTLNFALKDCKSGTPCIINIVNLNETDFCGNVNLPIVISQEQLIIRADTNEYNAVFSQEKCKNRTVSSVFEFSSTVKSINFELHGLSFVDLVPNILWLNTSVAVKSGATINHIGLYSCRFENSENITILEIPAEDVLEKRVLLNETDKLHIVIEDSHFVNLTTVDEAQRLVTVEYLSLEVKNCTVINVTEAGFLTYWFWKSNHTTNNEKDNTYFRFIGSTVIDTTNVIQIVPPYGFINQTGTNTTTYILEFLNNTIDGSQLINNEGSLLNFKLEQAIETAVLQIHIDRNIISNFDSDMLFTFYRAYNGGLTNMTFSYNDITKGSGDILFESFDRLEIIGNRLDDNGGLQFEHGNYLLFTNNTVDDGRGLVLEYVKYSLFKWSAFSSSSDTALTLFQTTSDISASRFNGNRGHVSGGAIELENSVVTIDSSSFDNNEANNYGGSIFAKDSKLVINTSSFTKGKAQLGGCVAASGTILEVYSSKFENCRTDPVENDPSRPLSESYIREHSGGAVLVYHGQFRFQDTSFVGNGCGENNKQPIGNGGAVHLIDTVPSATEFRRCTFLRNYAVNGGAVSALESNPIPNMLLRFRESTTFRENYAEEYGGGVVTYGTITADIAGDLNARDNSAKFGAVISTFENFPFISQASNAPLELQIQDNNAAIAGSVVYADFEVRENDRLRFLNNYNKNNAGGYGIRASKPTELSYYGVPFDSESTVIVPPNTGFNISVHTKDSFSSFVKQYPDIPILLQASSGKYRLFKDGKRVIDTNSGIASFEGIYLECGIGGKYGITITSPKVTNRALQFQVECVECRRGYRQDLHNSTNDITSDSFYQYSTCTWCPDGSYNLFSGTDHCKRCPNHAFCEGHHVISDKGFWASTRDNGTVMFNYFCPSGFCTGNNQCSDSRDPKLPVCAACLPGYSEWNGRCVGKYLTIIFSSIY